MDQNTINRDEMTVVHEVDVNREEEANHSATIDFNNKHMQNHSVNISQSPRE